MNCQEAIQRLIKLLGDLLQHFNHPLSDKDIGNIIEEVEKLISYIKNNCIKQIDIDLLNRLGRISLYCRAGLCKLWA